MKKVSCGFICISPKTHEILGCHPFGKGDVYDIPKGCIDDGETPFQCAVRELYEETGIVYPENENNTIDFGEVPYNREKNLHLFLFPMDKLDCINLSCESLIDFGKLLGKPEMNGYKWMSNTDKFYKNLKSVLDACLFSIDEKLTRSI